MHAGAFRPSQAGTGAGRQAGQVCNIEADKYLSFRVVGGSMPDGDPRRRDLRPSTNPVARATLTEELRMPPRIARRALSAILVAGVVLVTGAQVVQAASAHAAATTVNVTAVEYKFKLSTTTVKHGTVSFKVQNKGHLPHDFKIDGKVTSLISPGSTATLKVTFAKAGKYPYLCTVPGHAALGMKGTLTVT
jgi:uncharacterized cupredoxin-like copper-binding protein